MLRIFTFLMTLAFVAPVFAQSITMTVTNKTSSSIWVKFHSQDRRGHMWPSTTTHWPVHSGQTNNLKISCRSNEYICYGAKNDRNSSTWGMGYTGKGRCSDCCYRCNDTRFSRNLTY